MANLLGELDSNIVAAPTYNRKAVKSDTRRKVRVLSPPLTQKRETKTRNVQQQALTSSPPQVNFNSDDMPGIGGDDDVPMSDPMPSSPVTKAVERKAKVQVKEEVDEDEDLMDVAEAIGGNHLQNKSINIKGSKPMPKIRQLPSPQSSSPPASGLDVDAELWNSVTSKLAIVSSPASQTTSFSKMNPQDAVEDDGSLRMFWMDYVEINGSLCLFGKVKHKTTGKYLSTFVKVDNIQRKLYFLPRKHRHRNDRETSEEIDMNDVYEEVDGLMSRNKVTSRKVKPSTRKYAFELPDVPKETEYLKLLYPYDKPALPMEQKGETYSRVFGTNTSLFEQFVLWKNIMGPCWLNIQGADFAAVNNASWCKLECAVTKPSTISVLPDSEHMEVPRLTLMSLAFRTQHNIKDNKQEIVMVSARVYNDVSLTDTTPPHQMPSETFTIMRPTGSSYPIGFEADTKKQPGKWFLEKSEQFLLSKFLAIFERMDPDVLLGHNLQEVDYSTLLSRLREKKTPGWHRIGRLKRGEWPKTFGKTGSGF